MDVPPRGVYSGFRVSDVLEVSGQVTYSILLDESVIMAAMHIAALETEAVAVLSPDGGVHGVFTGYNLIQLLHGSPENAWASLYKTNCYEVDWKTLRCTPADSLEDLVGEMVKRRWGYAAVHRGENMYSIIGVLDIVRLLAKSGRLEKTHGLRIADLSAGPIVSVGVEASIYEVMGLMLRRRVRRIYVKDEDKIMTDRDIPRYLLSSLTVNEFRENPKDTLRRPVSAMKSYMRRPAELEPDTELREAVDKLLSNEAYTIVMRDKRGILTPWDITATLYQRQLITDG